MNITLKVIPDDKSEPYELNVNGRTILVWERAHRQNSFENIANGLRLNDIYGLAYTQAKISGVYTGSQDEFEAANEVEPVGATAPDPTDPAA